MQSKPLKKLGICLLLPSVAFAVVTEGRRAGRRAGQRAGRGERRKPSLTALSSHRHGDPPQTAFPRLHAAIEKLQESDDELASEGVVPEAALREALHGELMRRLQWSWRHAQLARKTDALSTLARQMDAPVALVGQYAELAWGQRASSEAGEPAAELGR